PRILGATLPVALVVNPLVRDADRLEGVDDGFEESWLGLLALLPGRHAVELGDAGAAGEDLHGRGVGDVLANQLFGDASLADVRRRGEIRLAGEGVDDPQLVGIVPAQLLELAAEDDVLPGLV